MDVTDNMYKLCVMTYTNSTNFPMLNPHWPVCKYGPHIWPLQVKSLFLIKFTSEKNYQAIRKKQTRSWINSKTYMHCTVLIGLQYNTCPFHVSSKHRWLTCCLLVTRIQLRENGQKKDFVFFFLKIWSETYPNFYEKQRYHLDWPITCGPILQNVSVLQ